MLWDPSCTSLPWFHWTLVSWVLSCPSCCITRCCGCQTPTNEKQILVNQMNLAGALFCSVLPWGWERTALKCEICAGRWAPLCQDGSFPGALIQLIRFVTCTRLWELREVLKGVWGNPCLQNKPWEECTSLSQSAGLGQESERNNSYFQADLAHEEPEALCPHCTPGAAQGILARPGPKEKQTQEDPHAKNCPKPPKAEGAGPEPVLPWQGWALDCAQPEFQGRQHRHCLRVCRIIDLFLNRIE